MTRNGPASGAGPHQGDQHQAKPRGRAFPPHPFALEGWEDPDGAVWLRVGKITEPGASERLVLFTAAVDFAATGSREDAIKLQRAIEALRLAAMVGATC